MEGLSLLCYNKEKKERHTHMLPPLAEERFTPLHWHRCRRQGIIFELAYKLGYDMEDFIKMRAADTLREL